MSPEPARRAFVVRPFGEKNGIDFERVHRELVTPVLATFGFDAQTTEVFAQAGNIRTDMFEQLMRADLVIADISIHNANVYYELGIRHALRDRATILIRSRSDEVPFDLRTDRYLVYDKTDPKAAIDGLSECVRQTLGSLRPDSPVFLLVPGLRPHDPESLSPVSLDFVADVRAAQQERDRSRLWLFAEEVASLDWATQAWRSIGRAQIAIQHFAGAHITWEQVRGRRPADDEANLALATIYQRLGDLTASSDAILRAAGEGLPPGRRAEALALRGSNLKIVWAREWRAVPAAERQGTALRSTLLYDACNAYREAFYEDQNHYYSGLNALALTTIAVQLAQAQPPVWESRYEEEAEAHAELRKLKTSRDRLEAAVRVALDGAEHRDRRSGEFNIWREMSEAAFALLTSAKPAFVARKYGDARRRLSESQQAATTTFPSETEARQIRLFLELDVLVENSRAALAELRESEAEAHPDEKPVAPRIVVFAGHRLDAKNRETPRFPAERASAVRAAMRALLEQERASAHGPIEGIAGGASGGDLIFHEVCAELTIPTRLLLALPPDRYMVESVQDSGAEWVEKFWKLCRSHEPEVLGGSKDLPRWLGGIRGYDVWQRNTLWTLATGLSRERAEVTLLTVWDGKPREGPGGTADMVRLARQRGVKVLEPIDPTRST
jgi:hypothetical protein